MRNELEYDYHKLGYDNLLRRAQKGESPDKVNDMLLRLLNKVAEKYPSWEIIIDTGNRAVIYENKERLGMLMLVDRWSDASSCYNDTYQISGPRVDAELSRKSVRNTQSIVRAMALIRKLFGARTIKETYTEALGEVEHSLGNLQYEATNDKRELAHKIEKALRSLMESNWELVKKTALATGMTEDELDQYQVKASELAELLKFKENAVCVVRYKDGYILDGAPLPHLFTPRHFTLFYCNTANSEMLTQEDRRKIGMLKLVKVNTYVPDVGHRTGENIFLIAREVEHDE